MGRHTTYLYRSESEYFTGESNTAQRDFVQKIGPPWARMCLPSPNKESKACTMHRGAISPTCCYFKGPVLSDKERKKKSAFKKKRAKQKLSHCALTTSLHTSSRTVIISKWTPGKIGGIPTLDVGCYTYEGPRKSEK